MTGPRTMCSPCSWIWEPTSSPRPLTEAALHVPVERAQRLLQFFSVAQVADAVPVVRAIIARTQNVECLAACLRVFADVEDLDTVREYLQHPSWQVRVQAVNVLGTSRFCQRLPSPAATALRPRMVGALSHGKGAVLAAGHGDVANHDSEHEARRRIRPGHARARARGGKRMSLMGAVFEVLGWVALAYLVAINVVYLILNVVSFFVLRRHKQRQTLGPLSSRFSNLELPVSLLIPAYNEEATVVATVRSLLQLNYSHFEIVVINDGSSDRTLDRLKEAFDLRKFPEVVRRRLATEPLRGVYRSATYPELKVIDKAERRQSRRAERRDQRRTVSALLRPGRRRRAAPRQPASDHASVPGRSADGCRRRHHPHRQRLRCRERLAGAYGAAAQSPGRCCRSSSTAARSSSDVSAGTRSTACS